MQLDSGAKIGENGNFVQKNGKNGQFIPTPHDICGAQGDIGQKPYFVTEFSKKPKIPFFRVHPNIRHTTDSTCPPTYVPQV